MSEKCIKHKCMFKEVLTKESVLIGDEQGNMTIITMLVCEKQTKLDGSNPNSGRFGEGCSTTSKNRK